MIIGKGYARRSRLCLTTALALSATTLSGCGFSAVEGVDAAPPPAAPVVLTQPPERDPSQLQVLFWTDEQRSSRFRAMEEWFAGHEVPAAIQPTPLENGAPLPDPLARDIRELMTETQAAGVMVWDDGAVRFEDYALGFGPEQRWTSFSVAKSFTSTLLGAAIADGFIASIDDPVTQYIPALDGSAYDDVSVRQLATMTSGVAWNEDYSDPQSDVAAMNRFVVEYGPDATVAQMRELEREAQPGEKWVYKTGETNLLGLLIENAVGLPLAQYAQDKIVRPAGFADPMFWMADPRGGNIGGCCLSLTLGDYTRMGIFALQGGGDVVPDGWFAEAGAAQVEFDRDGFGYGYQWWIYPGAFGAQGIFGQSITIVPEDDIVVSVVGNWLKATNNDYRNRWREIVGRIAALD